MPREWTVREYIDTLHLLFCVCVSSQASRQYEREIASVLSAGAAGPHWYPKIGQLTRTNRVRVNWKVIVKSRGHRSCPL